MKNKIYITSFFLLSLVTAGTSVYFFTKEQASWGALFALLAIIFFVSILDYIFRLFRGIENFSEAVMYRDFSKQYTESNSPQAYFFRYFNLISRTFLDLSREKETQQQYLKKMLELVDTGILAYDIETNETLWMNDAMKNMFRIPYLKNIDWLRKRNNLLYDELMQIPLGESRLLSIQTGKQTIKTLTNACTFQTDGKTYKLIAFHNISSTLEEVEAGAWKGLLNVMTHEIMNSIAPVASLADTLKKRIENIRTSMGDEIHPGFEDLEIAMETIRRRSEGLLKFSDTYRSLSKTIIPQMSRVKLYEVILGVYKLMLPSLQMKGIDLDIKTDHENIMANIDRNLIEQVLINFITNATHAVKEKKDPKIILFSGLSADEYPYMTVADNGCGIPDEVREKIFIPFFSTKKTGSGIGLSLSREIVKLHKGSLQIQTKVGEGSAFTILLNGEQ